MPSKNDEITNKYLNEGNRFVVLENIRNNHL